MRSIKASAKGFIYIGIQEQGQKRAKEMFRQRAQSPQRADTPRSQKGAKEGYNVPQSWTVC